MTAELGVSVDDTGSATDPEALYREAIVIDAHDHALDEAFWRSRDRSAIEFLTAPHAEGITAAIFACCLPSTAALGTTPAAQKYPLLVFLQMVRLLYEKLEEVGNTLMLATCAADIEEAKKAGKTAVILGLEDAGPTQGGDLFVLRMLHKLGLRHVLLAHEGRNNIATSSSMYDGKDIRAYDPALSGPGGLTPQGKRFVREMNRLGIIIDVSHLSDHSVWDVLEVSEKPVIASHSNTRTFPDMADTWKCLRNPTDEQIVALAKKGGVIGATGCVIGGKGKHPTLKDLFDRIDYLVELAGADHVGLGTDSAIGRIVPLDSQEPIGTIHEVATGLLARGHNPENVKKILGGNFMRVLKEIMG